jgi:hypothetical protein
MFEITELEKQNVRGIGLWYHSSVADPFEDLVVFSGLIDPHVGIGMRDLNHESLAHIYPVRYVLRTDGEVKKAAWQSPRFDALKAACVFLKNKYPLEIDLSSVVSNFCGRVVLHSIKLQDSGLITIHYINPEFDIL